jgi:hypothetical protein
MTTQVRRVSESSETKSSKRDMRLREPRGNPSQEKDA